MKTDQNASMPPKRRRTGCWTCKKRRVKCNEGQPMCSSCERLKLACNYGIKLLWREDALSRGIALGRSGTWSKKCDRPITRQQAHSNRDPYELSPTSCHGSVDYQGPWTQDWMFLNTTYQDFQPYLASHDILEADSLGAIAAVRPEELYLDPSSTSSKFLDLDIDNQVQPYVLRAPDHDLWPKTGETVFSPVVRDLSLNQPKMIQSPSPFALGGNEAFLLDYFTYGLIPQCTTWPMENPFLRTIVPICISALKEPLFNIVMAVASHQLFLLDDKRFEHDIWVYWGRALHGFQWEIRRLRSQARSPVGWEQIAATLIMLTFFDISHNESAAWLIHQRCARNVRALLPISDRLSDGQANLCRFFCAYFAEHEAFARTAYNLPDSHRKCVSWLPPELRLDMSAIDALLGCSHELISIILEVSDLADAKQAKQPPLVIQHEGRQDTLARRNKLERQLHTLQQLLPSTPPGPLYFDADEHTCSEELGHIAETRRLSALLYFYARLDGIPPGCSPIDKLTSQILVLIPKISLRSHALLWPLFVVGTMGIGVPSGKSGDSDRAFILERLVSLQRTRQLRHVIRAKEIVKAVWRIRDLRGPDSVGKWQDITRVDSYGVSLC